MTESPGLELSRIEPQRVEGGVERPPGGDLRRQLLRESEAIGRNLEIAVDAVKRIRTERPKEENRRFSWARADVACRRRRSGLQLEVRFAHARSSGRGRPTYRDSATSARARTRLRARPTTFVGCNPILSPSAIGSPPTSSRGASLGITHHRRKCRGVNAQRRSSTGAEAEALGDLFLEIVAASANTPDAATYLSKIKKTVASSHWPPHPGLRSLARSRVGCSFRPLTTCAGASISSRRLSRRHPALSTWRCAPSPGHASNTSCPTPSPSRPATAMCS